MIFIMLIEEEFVRKILLKKWLAHTVKLGSISLNNSHINPTDLKNEDNNDNYIKGLTIEELILLGIYRNLGENNIKKIQD